MPIVGEITYFDSNETVLYTDESEYLKAIEESFYYRGIHGWGWYIANGYPNLRLAVRKIELGEYGLDDDEIEKWLRD